MPFYRYNIILNVSNDYQQFSFVYIFIKIWDFLNLGMKPKIAVPEAETILVDNDEKWMITTG